MTNPMLLHILCTECENEFAIGGDVEAFAEFTAAAFAF
jgi:hypothetical protein